MTSAAPGQRLVRDTDPAIDGSRECRVAVLVDVGGGKQELRFERCSAEQAREYAAGNPAWRVAPGESWWRRAWRRIAG